MKREVATLTVTHLDAAIRQLKTAIRLFFHDEDPCSIYTLTQNAHEILSKLLKQRGERTMWDEMVEDRIRPEYKERVRLSVQNPRNFLKHGRTEKGAIFKEETELVFYPEANPLHLLHAVNAVQCFYPEVFSGQPDLTIFHTWFCANHPEALLPEARAAFEEHKQLMEDRALTKLEFYETYTQAARERAMLKV